MVTSFWRPFLDYVKYVLFRKGVDTSVICGATSLDGMHAVAHSKLRGRAQAGVEAGGSGGGGGGGGVAGGGGVRHHEFKGPSGLRSSGCGLLLLLFFLLLLLSSLLLWVVVAVAECEL